MTGIDPDAATPPDSDDLVSWTFIRSRFEDWVADSAFHVINADQSLYYMDNLSTQVGRVADLLHVGGFFIATCWSKEDTLHQIRVRLFHDRSGDLVGEQLIPDIASCGRLELIEQSVFRTQVDLGMWRQSRELLEAAVRIIARQEVRGKMEEYVERLSQILEGFPSRVPRVNVAIAARRMESQHS